MIQPLYFGVRQPEIHGGGILGGVVWFRRAGNSHNGFAVAVNQPVQGDLGWRYVMISGNFVQSVNDGLAFLQLAVQAAAAAKGRVVQRLGIFVEFAGEQPGSQR